jgi:hypothetical protein
MRLSVLLLCLWILSPSVYAAKLYVNATPSDAKIQLLSQKAEFSQGVTLAAGKYYLSVSKRGYQRYMQPVVLKDEDVTLDVVLQQTAFPLTVTTTPADAQIRILNILPKYQDGILLPQGKYDIEVRKPGYVTQRQVAEMKAQPTNLTIILQEVTQPHAAVTSDNMQPTYPLYVYTTPRDATVELLDTEASFQQGIALPTGSYHLRVSQSGYTSRHEWVNITKGKNKFKIALSEPDSCYFVEDKIEENQEVLSVLRNVTLKPRGDLLEVSYYEQKLPANESTHLEFIGVNQGKHIALIGTFDNEGVAEEITAELLIDKENLSMRFRGVEALLNQTQCF